MIKLKQLRESREVKQITLAHKLQVSNTTVSNWETGKRTPDLETIVRIATYFNVSTDYLLGREYKGDIVLRNHQKHNKEKITKLFNKVITLNDRGLEKLDIFLDALIEATNRKKQEEMENAAKTTEQK